MEYLTFSFQTFVHFDKNLIDIKLLNKEQIDWLNDYYKKIRKNVGDYLKENNYLEAYNYLISKTEPFEYIENSSNSFKTSSKITFFWALIVFISKIDL